MKVAILGYGTVGSGVFEVMRSNPEGIARRAGEDIEVKYVLDLRDFPGDPVEEVLVHDFAQVVNDPEIGVVIEVMGGVEPAYSFVKEALLKGKSVCTSNKELVAKHGAELLEIAKQKKENFLFEASVGGGIPIIRPLNQSLTADEIQEVTGILNGTTNYILTKMRDEGADFKDALADAQAKGYAERNPSADVDGFDAGRKIAILTSLAYGMQVDYEDIYTEGIAKITREDIAYAGALGASIKLFGTSKTVDGKVYAMVAPRMVGKEHPLYVVDDVFNAVLVRGNFLGDIMFYGKGAGKLPTASAVVSDVVDAVKHQGVNVMTIWNSRKLELADINTLKNCFFVRVPEHEREKAEGLFAVDREVKAEGVGGEYAFLTKPMTEGSLKKAASKVKVLSRIRVENVKAAAEPV